MSVVSEAPFASSADGEPALSAQPEVREPAGAAIVSRRAWLGALAGVTMGAAGRRARAAPPASIGDPDPSTLLNRLVNRVTFGLNAYELGLVRSLGYSGYLEYHLNYPAIFTPGIITLLSSLTTLNLPAGELYLLPANQVLTELIDSTLLRAYYSRQQLYERMVEFWSDHFSIDIQNGMCRWLKTVDDRTVIRPHALGRFPDMLTASARSPAMLYFLDNVLSVAGAPNENYARELMELHTLGVDGGYTQNDVLEVARCFTGWTVHPPTADIAIAGTYYFNAAIHDDGEKRVLGNVIPAGGGEQDGVRVLQILAGHPSCARFIAKKICRRFLGDGLPRAVIDSVASIYTSTGGDIRAMVRRVLQPQHLAIAPPKYKRPMHAYTSALRATNGQMSTPGYMRSQLTIAGHLPFHWGPPDGYPDSNEAWSGLVLPRWNFGALFATGGLPGLTVDTGAFFAGLSTAPEMVNKISDSFFGGDMLPGDREQLLAYLSADPTNLTRQKETLGLAIGSPGFQWC